MFSFFRGYFAKRTFLLHLERFEKRVDGQMLPLEVMSSVDIFELIDS